MATDRSWDLVVDDATSFLQDMPPSSADLIISSPPYFMGKEYDTSLRVEDFAEIHARLAPLLLATLKPGGSLCWQVGNHVRDGVTVPLDILTYNAFSTQKDLFLRNRIVWSFGHGTHASKRFSGRYETVLWFTKGRDYFFDLNAVRVPQKYPGKKHYKGERKGQFSGNPLGKNPSDLWEIPNVKANHVEKTDHPCQFPVALVQRLVKALCPQNGLVVDCFAGSASAGVAALLEGRRFAGCDINQTYVKIGRERLAASVAGTVQYRSIDDPIFVPNPGLAVTQRPAHFSKTVREN